MQRPSVPKISIASYLRFHSQRGIRSFLMCLRLLSSVQYNSIIFIKSQSTVISLVIAQSLLVLFLNINLEGRYFPSQKILMQALQFPRGNLYQIVCQEGNQALAMQARSPADFKDSRVIGAQPNAHDPAQLWMIEKVGHKEDEFEIVNALSTLVWDEEGREIHLRFGKQKGDQLFKVERVNKNAFWFKTESNNQKAVALEGVLRYKNFDPNHPNQIFFVSPVNNSNALAESCILVNNNSGKAIDIPGGTHDHGERLIQWEKNKRFNQRWRWVKRGGGFMLKSLLTGQCIDIAGEKKDDGAKVVQWDETGGSNQLWRPRNAGNNLWKIESVHAPSMFLSIANDKVDDGGKLEISQGERQSQYWRIEGHLPQ